ncbi:2-C-methyl-D-erythritol 4-phosphate cytidylyltransferase [Balneola vulgaris]|uniref:2-C-methyl-D-erythritol 4-phosphate cytidylyltransferase n=1 Tax=Balneola vulgaris TaxID=287535 RepID=UPI00037D8C0E|nr:2-C-methyl-D-erythritol 4-phosphate cytidylyltransferase [Balneola vulgaris]
MSIKAAIIPAAGSGTRLGSEIPKPFLPLGGAPILQHTLSQFINIPGMHQIIIATSAPYMEKVRAICEKLNAGHIQFDVIEGGSERQFSIQNALETLADEVELVAIHDAVRPFISEEVIVQCFDTAENYDGAIVAVRAKDTLKKVNTDLTILETPDRSAMWQAQTPQIFQKHIIIEANQKAIDEGFLGTDDASLVEYAGYEVKVVEGERDNFKITYPIDLKIAEFILKEKL